MSNVLVVEIRLNGTGFAWSAPSRYRTSVTRRTAMEDVVAVRVTLVGGRVRFFMTWGQAV